MNNFEVIRIRTIGVDGVEVDFRPSSPIDIVEYTYVSSRMSGSTLTAEVRDVECLDSLWTGREFVDVMEGGVSSRYRLVGVPSSRKDVDDARYVHSLVFESERDSILSGLYFCDAVDGDAASVDKYQSGSYEVFFHGTLSEFIDRFNDVLLFRGVRGLRVRLEEGVESEKKEYSVSSATLFGALQEAYRVWEVPFYFSGDDIVFGEGGEAVPNVVFGYGVDRELVSISKTNQGAKVVTLCAGTGSSENLPYYYPNETPYGRMGAKLNGGEGVSVEDGVKYAEVVGRSGELVYAGDDPGDATDSVTYNGKVTSSGVGSAFATDVEFVSGKACPVVFSTRFAMNGYRGKVDLDFGLRAGFKGEDELIYNHIGPERMTGPMDPHRVAEEGFDFDITSVMVSISGPSTNIYRAGDFPYETFYGEAKTGEVEALVDGKVVYLRCQDFQRASNPVKGVSIDLEEVLKGQNVDVRDCTCIVTVLANVKTHVNWVTRKNKAVTFIFTNIGFSRFFEPSGWLLNGKSTFLSLASMGLRMDREPIIGDKISPVVLQYIRPTGVLMPSVYRETLGAERALPALNGEYLLPGETDKYYHFDNEYDASNPREHVQAFEDVKPSIENLKDEAGNPRNVLEGVHFDPGYNIIETKEGSSELKYSHFFVKIAPLGFNLFDHALEGGEMGLIMLDGDCGACRFNILVTEDGKNAVQVDENGALRLHTNGYVDINEGNIQEEQNDTTDNSVWLCLALDSQTYGGGEFGVMPSYDSATGKGQKPQAGEKYTLIDIRMPEEYIRAAEKELDAQIVKFMSENNDDKYAFSVNFSRIYLAQNPEVRDALSSHCSLRLFYDGAELAAPLHVVQYTRKQTFGEALPEISVELGDIIEAPSSGLRERIATELGTMIHTVQGSTKEEASDKYLRKDVEDVSEALTGFLKGIKVGEYVPGLGGRGGAIIPNADGEVIAEVDYLNVRKKATFAEVVLDKIRSIGGKTLISLASVECSAVEPSENAYKCYFSTDDGEGGVILNDFVVGDLAICQSFSTNNTKYYWRKVVAVGEGYVTLSDVSGEYAEGSDIPAKGDTIVQLGHVSDVERQNAIILSAYGENAPSIVQYKGINSFSLAGKEITILSPKNNLLTGIVKMTAGSSGLEQFEEWAAKQELIDSKASGEDIENLGKEIADLDYLKAAVKEDTTILGGLVQTSTIKLGYTDEQGVRHTMSGTNGRYMPDKKGGGIAAWWGGDMSEESAKALVRFDGTGFFANGLFKWDDEIGVNLGNDAIKLNYDGSVVFGKDIRINTAGNETLGSVLTSLSTISTNVTELNNSLKNKLDKSLFDTLFTPHYDKDGKLESIEAKVSLWSNGEITALGPGSGGSGGGGGEGGADLLDVWISIAGNSDSFKDYQVNPSHLTSYLTRAQIQETYATKEDLKNIDIPTLTESDPIFKASAAYGITSSDIANWNSIKSAIPTALSDLSNDVGYITSAAIPSTYAWSAISGKPNTLAGYGITDAYTASTIDNKLSGYLPLSGGTITSTSNIPLTLNSTHSSSQNVIALQAGGNAVSYIGYYPTYGVYIQNYAVSGTPFINITSDGSLKRNNSDVFYHSGNSNLSTVPWACSNLTIGSSYLAGTDAKLAVWGNHRIYRADDSRSYLDITVDDVSVYYNGYDTDGWASHYFQSNGNTLMTIAGYSGNVGIGTTEPTYKLDVNGPIAGHEIYSLAGWMTLLGTENVSYSTYLDNKNQYGLKIHYSNGVAGAFFSQDGNTEFYGNIAIYAAYGEEKGFSVSNSKGWVSMAVNGGGNSYISTSSQLAIYTNNSQKMLVTSAGTVLIGATTDYGQRLQINGITRHWRYEGGEHLDIEVTDNRTTFSGYGTGEHMMFEFYSNDNLICQLGQYRANFYNDIVASGEITALGSSSSSDRRLKDIVSRPTPLTLEDIAKLNIISFKWNHRENDKRLKIGLVAQEVQEILPELVGVDRSNYLTLDYSTFGSVVGVLNTKKILSLEEEVIALRNEVKELRRKIYG